jgi:hypothetical protein
MSGTLSVYFLADDCGNRYFATVLNLNGASCNSLKKKLAVQIEAGE